jgi:Zn-dependent M28 family amino/carboxypeptidase
MSLRDLGFYLRGRINRGVSLATNSFRSGPPMTPPPVEQVIRAAESPAALIALLEGRSNPARQATARYLAARGIAYARHTFDTFEGGGENFSIDIGSGDRVVMLIAHHDAVPGSPGANDNAAAVAILLRLLETLPSAVSPRIRVRLLFTAAEELGYLGARAYVKDAALSDVAGVLSLELCGVGDSIAVWDAAEETPFLASVRRGLEGLGLRADEGYHQVGRIPVFGSDHRAFASTGIPAYGLSVVPLSEADALRQFVFNPVRTALRQLVRRPRPFDTYHTTRDSSVTIDPAALTLVSAALLAIVTELR